MNKTAFFIILTLLLTSCATKKQIFIQTQRLNQVQEFSNNYFSYFLPKTQIIIDLQVTKTVENKGPYADYAQDFLGNLANIIKKNRTYWQITDIKISSRPIRDTNNIWVVKSSFINAYNFQLTPQGFPVALNKTANYKPAVQQTQSFTLLNKKTDSSETLLIIDQGYKEVYDTIFKTQTYDTIQRTIPIIKKQLIKKSIREQARDLADKIFELRDYRESLLIGDNDQLPDGQALRQMLAGIARLEKQYLAQFIGRTDKTIFHYKFAFTPEPTNNVVQTILFRFSPKLGLLPANDLNGQPVILEIQSHQTVDKIKSFSQKQNIIKILMKNPPQNSGLAYRIPELVTIKLIYNGQILAKTQLLVAQFGIVQHLPAQIFKNPNLKIEFYPDLGSIKSISSH